MIDAADTLRDYLLSDPALFALVSNRIWMGLSTPPPNVYKPSQGGALTIAEASKNTEGADTILRKRWQCKAYGPDIYTIEQVDMALVAAMLAFAARRAGILGAELSGGGPILPEAGSGWLFKPSFYETRMKSALPAPV